MSSPALNVAWSAPGHGALLGPEIGRGGEAHVYHWWSGAAKIYRGEVLRDGARRSRMRAKIEAMCRMQAFRADRRYAWPLCSLYRDRGCTEWIGYAMRKCPADTVGMEALGSLRTIREYLPGWNRLTIARAMERLVGAVRNLSDAGVIIGDVSPSNFRCGPDGSVYCIDADSYQVRVGAQLHRSPVLTLQYAPPELAGGVPTDIERRDEHLRFSIGVLVFFCLTHGVHPFQRTWGEDPVENLKSGKTAIGGARASGWLPPYLWDRYNSLHPALKRCCVQAFVAGHSEPAARPTLAHWQRALQTHIGWLETRAAA